MLFMIEAIVERKTKEVTTSNAILVAILVGKYEAQLGPLNLLHTYV